MQKEQQRFDIYEHVTKTIISLLEQGTIPWRKPWITAGPPRNLLTRHWYTGINHLLLNALPYTKPYYLTFKQIKAVAGRVKAGEKGHFIVFRKTIIEQDPKDTEKTTRRNVLRYYIVFNVEQCENIPPALIPSYAVPLEHKDPIQECEFVIEDYKTCPSIHFGSDGASYVHVKDYINMPFRERFISQEQFYATLFHEMIHSTGHESRLNRKEITESPDYETDEYALEELVAEIGAGYLCSFTGIESATIKHHAAYIKSWLQVFENDKKFVVIASARAQKAVDYILNIDRSNNDAELFSEQPAGQ